jgi:aspartyl-tRNA(Asn)/glutamyl-tRNA(Gln) amidotransferase subunit A
LHPRARTIAGEVACGGRTARAVCDDALARIATGNARLNAVVQMDPERSLAEAADVDRRVAAGEDLPLAGVPYTLKDNLWAKGWRVSQGSKLFADFVAPRDAWCVERFRAAGAVLVGITNCSELACKGVTDNPLYGTTRNPWNTALTPGGSSGGAAAATAAGFTPLALCTDAGGSTRRPAAHVGLVGMKPSLGLVPYLPHTFPEPNLGISVIGVMAHDVEDAELALRILSGYCPADPYSVPLPHSIPLFHETNEGRDETTHGIQGVWPPKVAWSADLGCGFPIDADVLACLLALVAKLDVEQASPQWPEETGEYPLAAMQQSGVAAFYGAAMKDRRADIDPDILALLDAGLKRTGAEIAACVLKREVLVAALEAFFERYDLLLAPTAPVTAWPIGQLGPAVIGGEPASPRGHAAFTPLFNYCGVPACSIPAGLVRGLPVGLQIIGPRFQDARVLRYARHIQSLAPVLELPSGAH